MAQYDYRMMGTCARTVSFELDGEKRVHNVEFLGGCNGNLKGIGKLVEGMPAERVIALLSGNTCGFRDTSCADQFARALKEALGQ